MAATVLSLHLTTHPHTLSFPSLPSALTTNNLSFLNSTSLKLNHGLRLLSIRHATASLSTQIEGLSEPSYSLIMHTNVELLIDLNDSQEFVCLDYGAYDPELREVLELATDSELYELEGILFGPSYFSPLFKSIASSNDIEYVAIGEDLEEREAFISHLESRFLFLAADARSTLRGWRPSYRSVLLGVRKKLKISCSSKLPTPDLEIEIFLHLLQDSSEDLSWEKQKSSDSHGLSDWKLQGLGALKLGAAEVRSMILKGGGMFTLGKLFQLLSRRLSGRMFLEAANYQIKNEVIKKGGQLAAVGLESRAALLAARQGLAGAASRYLGLRTMVSFLGPVLWGTFLADVVIQNLGTDYARILRAIYAFAQIRVTRTYGVQTHDG